MRLLQKCCGCIELRTSVETIAIFRIVCGLLSFSLAVCYEFAPLWYIIWPCLYVVFAGLLLLFGIIKNNKEAIIVYLTLLAQQMIAYIVALLFLIYTTYMLSVHGGLNRENSLDAFGILVAYDIGIFAPVLIEICLWIFPKRFYQRLNCDQNMHKSLV